MAISKREVKNSKATGIPSIIFDVNVKYRSSGKQKALVKRGFLTEEEARCYETQMKKLLQNPEFVETLTAEKSKNPTFLEFTTNWLESQVKSKNSPQTYRSYQSSLQAHVVPVLGKIPEKKLASQDLDKLYLKLRDTGVSDSTLSSIHKTVSSALTHGKKSGLLENNIGENVTVTFQRESNTAEPYNEKEVRILLKGTEGTEYGFAYILASLYGLRIGEVLGLRSVNVDVEKQEFSVVEQLPDGLSRKVKHITELAPLKSESRTLPITDVTLPYFAKA